MGNNDSLFVGVLILLCLIWALSLFGLSVSDRHRQKVFYEHVIKHNCKIVPYWRDGNVVTNGLCIMPDGTVITTTSL